MVVRLESESPLQAEYSSSIDWSFDKSGLSVIPFIYSQMSLNDNDRMNHNHIQSTEEVEDL